MKITHSFISVVSLFSALMFSPLVLAQDEGGKLVEEARCYACHQMNEPSLGPSYQAIAVRHGPRKDVMVEVLAAKIVRGGGGNWGLVPMVPNQRVSLKQAKDMAEWILGQASQ